MNNLIPECVQQARIQAAQLRDQARVSAATGVCYGAVVSGARLDEMAEKIREVMNTTCAAITVVLRDEQHMLASAGYPRVTLAREDSICTHMIGTHAGLVIPDTTRDSFFESHSAVKHAGIKSYCGVPLVSEGEVIGGVCAFDMEPRSFTDLQVQQLLGLSSEVHRLLSVPAPRPDDVELIYRPALQACDDEPLAVFAAPRKRAWWRVWQSAA